MKQINGKSYYVCLGFIPEEKIKEMHDVDTKQLKSIFIKPKKESDSTVMYVDDSDKDNVVGLPLIPINGIQRKGDMFKFILTLDPFYINFEEENYVKINTVLLFSVYKKDNIEYIQHVSSYQTEYRCITKRDKSITLFIEATSKTIMGE